MIEPGEDGTYRVYSGSFEKLDNAAKMEQTLRKAGFSTYIIDISTKNLVDGADITPVEILKRYGIEWEDFDPLGKAASIDVMSKAAAFVLPQLYAEGSLMLSFLLEADRTQKWRQWQ